MGWLSQVGSGLPNTVGQGLIWGIIAIGVYITYRILDIADLTVDGTVSAGGAVTAVLILNGVDPWIAMLAAFGIGLLAGLMTGLFHTWMGIPAILSGILTQLALYSVNLRIQGQANLSISTRKYHLIVSGNKTLLSTLSWDNPILVLALITVALIALIYWFLGTEYGCGLRAVGANPQMARAQGINTDRGKVVALMLSNGIIALGGSLLTQYSSSADVKKGVGAIVIGLAAIIIGEVVFGKLFRNFALKLLAVSIGAIIYYLVIQIVLMLGLKTDDLKMLTALVVALFLAVPHWKARLGRKGGAPHA